MINGLAQTTLKLTTPGVPAIYQGCELWDLSLVDPDNRRPVDYGRRVHALRDLGQPWREGIDPAGIVQLLDDWPSGRIKLFVIRSLLELRRANPSRFRDGSYVPVATEGPRAENVCSFLRTEGDASILVAVPRLIAPWTRWPEGWPVGDSTWQGTSLLAALPETAKGLRNLFTGEPLSAGEPAADGTGVRFDLGGLFGVSPIGVWA